MAWGYNNSWIRKRSRRECGHLKRPRMLSPLARIRSHFSGWPEKWGKSPTTRFTLCNALPSAQCQGLSGAGRMPPIHISPHKEVLPCLKSAGSYGHAAPVPYPPTRTGEGQTVKQKIKEEAGTPQEESAPASQTLKPTELKLAEGMPKS
jgi:hypothetical protein